MSGPFAIEKYLALRIENNNENQGCESMRVARASQNAQQRKRAKRKHANEGVEEDSRNPMNRRKHKVMKWTSPPPAAELLQPSMIKIWDDIPSWEGYIQSIDYVDRHEDVISVWFKLYVVRFCICNVSHRCFREGETAGCRENSEYCKEKLPQSVRACYLSRIVKSIGAFP